MRARSRAARPDSAELQLHRGLRDAGVGVPEAARAGAGRAGVPAGVRRPGPARGALVVHRVPPALGAALVAVRRWRPVRAGGRARRPVSTRRRSRARAGAAASLHRRRGGLLRLRPRAHGRAARRSAGLRSPGAARHGADALRRAGRLRPSQAHGHDHRQRRPAGRARHRARIRAGRGRTIAEVRCVLAGPVPRGEPAAGPAHPRARCPPSSRTCRASASKRWWRGSSSTSTPATPSRSCPRSAGRRRCRSRRSRSTVACGRSTRARTCTSWTSATSRSRARAPSRC